MALKNIMRVDNGNVIYSGGSDGTVSFDLMTKLWENPDPTQTYSTGTITLSSSDYDMLLFQFAHANTNTDLIISAITEKGKNVLANEVISGSSNPCRLRACDYVSDTSYDVQIAYSGPASASITGQSSNALIPYKVYGIKTKQSTKMDVLVTDVSTSASKCMMSDGETSVEDAIDEINDKVDALYKLKYFNITVPSGVSSYNYNNYKPSDFNTPISAISIGGGTCVVSQIGSSTIYFTASLSSSSVIRILYIVN